ncbi:MAG: glycosyltransferase [candidate division Zixibacteria bacterium]|nr:glycosyltransferase [candidate division Zixibacteria bacterium]
MRVILLTQYFPPETGAAQNRLFALAKAFRKRGHQITVLTSLPNYPTGRIFEDYRYHYKYHEKIEGIEILRSWLYVHPSRGTIPTALSYLTFASTSLDIAIRHIDSADVIVWEYPPLFLGYTAMKLARRYNARLVTNFADLWTDLISEHRILSSQFIIRRFKSYERKIIERSDLVTAQTEGLIDKIRNFSPDSNPRLWPNGADTKMFYPREKDEDFMSLVNPDGKFIVGYAGLHGRNHNLSRLLEAANLLKDDFDIEFVFCGDGFEKPKLIKLASDLELENVVFYDPVRYADVPRLMSCFDLGVVIHRNLPGLSCVRSAKLFELMAMGIPILHIGKSEGAEIVRKAEAGVVVEHEFPAKIADAVHNLKSRSELKKYSSKGRKNVIEIFDREKISLDIVSLTESLWN